MRTWTITLVVGGSFPWIRWSTPTPLLRSVATATLAAPPAQGVTDPHRSWVMTENGPGWIDHHGPEGYTIRLVSGEWTVMGPGAFVNISPP